MPKVKKATRRGVGSTQSIYVRSETQLFEPINYDVSLESTHSGEHYPITSITDQNSPLEFFVQSNDVQFIDLAETKLYIKAKILKTPATILGATEIVTTANNFLHTMFQQAAIYLNEVLVTPASNQYAYRSYLDTLLSYNKEFKESQAQCALYYKEDNPSTLSSTVEDGFKHRNELTKESKVFEMVGRPFCDLFLQNKYLIPGTDLRLSFLRSTPAFCLLSTADITCEVKILEARLLVKKHTLLPSLLTSTLQSMDQGNPATYPMKRVEIKTYSIATGSGGDVNEHLLTGLLPDRIVIGLISSASYSGNIRRNPFAFGDFNMSRLEIGINGDTTTYLPLIVNFEDGQYIQAYNNLFEGLGVSNDDVGLDITRKSYKNHPLFVYNLRHILDGFAFPKYGSVKIDMKFRETLAEGVTVLVYAEYQSVLCIDKSKNVYFKDFTNTTLET